VACGSTEFRRLGACGVRRFAQELTTNDADTQTNVVKKLYRQRLPHDDRRNMLIDKATRAALADPVARKRVQARPRLNGKFRRFLTLFVRVGAQARDSSR
jgi:hypothetical protein